MTLNDLSRLHGESAMDLGDKYTMNDAARIKGVSYHTVSRAVRTGRLRAERLGRMALISPEDLDSWQPKRERAPKRFRDRDVREASWLERVEDAPPDDVVTGLADVFRELHQVAMQQSASELGDAIARYLAQLLGLTRVTLWVEVSAGIWNRLAIHGSRLSGAPDTLHVSRETLTMPQYSKAHVVPDLHDYMEHFSRASVNGKKGPVLVLPMFIAGKQIAFALGDTEGQPISISPRQLEMAEGLAANLAFIIEHALVRERARKQMQLEQATMSASSDGVRILDASGEVNFTNEVWLEMFGGDWTWTCATDGKPLEAHDLSSNEVLHLNGEAADGQTRTLIVKSTEISLEGEVIGLASRATDQAARRDREKVLQRELDRMRAVIHRFDAMNEAMLQIGESRSINDVVNSLVGALVDFMGAKAGAAMLRNESGKFVIVTNVEGILTEASPRVFDPISVPSTVMAMAQRSSLVVRRADAGSTEQWCMNAFKADIKVIVPLLAADITIGAAYLFFEREVAIEQVDLDFLVDLGTRCARLIDRLRLIEIQGRAEERLREIIDQFPQAVFILDYPTLHVKNANRIALEIFAEDMVPERGEVPRVQLLDVHGDELTGKDHPVTRTVMSGESTQGEPMILVKENGEQIEVLASHVLLQDHAGKVTGVMCIYQDRANMNRLDAERDEFLGVVAHELRNPLTSLRGNLQLLQRRIRKREQTPYGDEDLSRVEIVLKDVDRIADLLGRMLDVSRIRRGKLNLSFAETNAVGLVESMVASARGGAPDRDIQASTPAELTVVWDQVRIEQILRNLLNNAVTYTETGPIEVGLESAGETVALTVRDHGPGVPDVEKQRLFQRYYRSEDESPEESVGNVDGLGVGLYLSERIARAHGGSLVVEDAPGGGALFRLTLPRRAQIEDQAEPSVAI